jgi:tRNA modification GTPase
VEAAVVAEITTLKSEMAVHLADRRRGERLREGLVFAITGPPNVGKSALVNALAERDVAIVSATPGTTRDALETRIVLGGVPVTLVDTAGLRETADEIEAEGVRRALARAAAADLVISVCEAGDSTPPIPETAAVWVANKIDLGGAVPVGAIGVSALTGASLSLLRDRLAGEARAALQGASARLADAQQADLPELRAEDLRLALRALGRITGEVGVEDILDALFAQFCIGK